MYHADLLCVLHTHGLKLTRMPVRMKYAPKYRFSNRTPVEYNIDGVRHTPVRRVPAQTLARWLAEREDKCATCVVQMTRHYALVSGRQFLDTFTKGLWVPIGSAPRRRKRVEVVRKVTK